MPTAIEASLSRGADRPGDAEDGNVSVSSPAEQRLIGHLLRHYDVDARGVASIQSTVRVAIELVLLRMQQLVIIRLITYSLVSSRFFVVYFYYCMVK